VSKVFAFEKSILQLWRPEGWQRQLLIGLHLQNVFILIRWNRFALSEPNQTHSLPSMWPIQCHQGHQGEA